WHLLGEHERSTPKSTEAAQVRDESLAARKPNWSPAPGSVPLNRGPDVVDGFRGDVHPLLHGSTRLELTAHWGPVGKGRDKLDRAVDPAVYSWFTELKPARTQQTYTERDFSGFLPEAVGEVGQLWAVDADRVVTLLRQFHRHPLMHQVASGRRA